MSTQPSADAIAAARASQAKWHIPASVTLAQWALESAWGRKVTGKHNYFGVKARSGEPCTVVRTTEVINGKPVKMDCAFRDYASMAEAFEAHARLLATGKAYAPFRAALPDLVKATDLLGHGTSARPSYATDPQYGPKLMAVIRGSKLTAYDA